MTARYLALFAVNVLVIILQTSFAYRLSIHGVKPDLSLIAAVMHGYLLGPLPGFASGLLQGLFMDVFNGHSFGLHLFWYGLSGLFAGWFERPVFVVGRFFPTVLVGGLTFLAQAGVAATLAAISAQPLARGQIIIPLFVMALYNMLVVTIFFPQYAKLWRWWRRRSFWG